MLSLLICLFLVPTLAAAGSGSPYYVCNLNPNGDNFLALRFGPGSGYEMIMRLPPGSGLNAVDYSRNGWLPVEVETAGRDVWTGANMPRGWVYDAYVCRG